MPIIKAIDTVLLYFKKTGEVHRLVSTCVEGIGISPDLPPLEAAPP